MTHSGMEALFAFTYSSPEMQADRNVLKAVGHVLAYLDDLKDDGRLKVLRNKASVNECGEQMRNCLSNYGMLACGGQILV